MSTILSWCPWLASSGLFRFRVPRDFSTINGAGADEPADEVEGASRPGSDFTCATVPEATKGAPLEAAKQLLSPLPLLTPLLLSTLPVGLQELEWQGGNQIRLGQI